MKTEEIIIVGGGPCGLAAAIALRKKGKDPLIIEKGNIVNAIYNYPTHQTFFSSSEKLAIGDVPFITENHKPKRNQALVYYREVVKREALRINKYEKVIGIEKSGEFHFNVKTDKQEYTAGNIIIATGYYDNPNFMGIPGEDLPKVSHYFKEAHPYFDMEVAVIGGKNSSVDAAIELVKAGARVTVLYRGAEYSPSIKPWVLPEFEALVKTGMVNMVFNAHVKEVTSESIIYEQGGSTIILKNDHVFAMTGYRPDHAFLEKMGVKIEEETGRPYFDPETMETNVSGIYIAGVIAAGNNANEIFIENGRFHGGQIADAISSRTRNG
ncbi:YpdA family putative bacillithiol disulfide reductase [Mesobacillus subterraneus]|uniref:YpdA family putative bacillithiol disulfide reductase n=1 Tax=Mesobacillus subterraneus TaxID=285983 RepID=UPI00203B8A8F|nr:YpdA family putative bacillithiol disulfide reductase [Mesobacillus subterraneus]MCM3665313.1 YpdA family putative bacillithiol disulfide reductase [Mesobacillus subterraneus]MCM3684679.1 YpdA family putative bacillithiol disulfide reductase [Mesobacillus subterraneus]